MEELTEGAISVQQPGEGGVRKQDAVLRIVHDEGDVVGGQSRIDGMADRAHAGHAVVDFEMAVIVPRERRHPIAQTDAELRQNAREPPAAALDLGVGGAVQREGRRGSRSLPHRPGAAPHGR